MTGLDHTRDRIVEIATIVTDDELRIIAEGPDLVVHADDDGAGGDGARSSSRCTRSRDCSTRSAPRRSRSRKPGRRRSTSSAARAPTRARSRCAATRSAPTAASSTSYLPEIENYLHYRSVDVSSVKELVKRWYPDLTQSDAAQGRVCTVPSTTSAARSRSCATTAAWSSCRRSPSGCADRRAPSQRRAVRPLMRAVVLTEYGGPEVLRVSDVADPVPGPDEILVAVEHSAVNRADVLQRLGRYSDPRRPARSGDPGPRVRRHRRRAAANGSRTGRSATP